MSSPLFLFGMPLYPTQPRSMRTIFSPTFFSCLYRLRIAAHTHISEHVRSLKGHVLTLSTLLETNSLFVVLPPFRSYPFVSHDA